MFEIMLISCFLSKGCLISTIQGYTETPIPMQPPQSKENSNPHTTRLAQQAVVSFDAPLVDDVVLADAEDEDEDVATTKPEEAAVTSCPSTVFASPPAVNFAVYTANTPDEISLAVKVSDSNVKVWERVEVRPGSSPKVIVWPTVSMGVVRVSVVV